jgi:hypothetical protein
MALVIVLITVVFLALAALIFARLMFTERQGAYFSGRERQVRLLAESGIESLRITLLKDSESLYELGELYANEELFRGCVVTDGEISMTGYTSGTTFGSRTQADFRDIGRFSVIASALADDSTLTGDSIRYGLEDESTKFNLKWLAATEKQLPGTGRTFLLRMPGMTEEIADSLLDWLDDDDETREYGAENDYYATLDPPYYAKNGIPDSLDELLLVKGITPALLYGIDWNRNGRLDLGEPEETTLDEEFGVTDGSLNLGLISYFTLDSCETTINPTTGLPKVNINNSDTTALREALEEQLDDSTWIDYIVAYKEQTETVKSILELVESSTESSNSAESQSPFKQDATSMASYLPILYDTLTTSDTPIVGRININQASRGILMTLVDATAEESTETSTAASAATEAGASTTSAGNLTTDMIEAIIEQRILNPAELESDSDMRYPFWLYTRGIITDFETLKKYEPYICTGGAVYKAQIIGRFDEQSPVVRLEVWLDASNSAKPAKVIRVRELTNLGPGFTATELGVETMNDRTVR